MQPVLILTADTPGMICLNGRMAGEVDKGRAPVLPVTAYGAGIVEHRPFGADFMPLCARLTLSAGEPVPASIEGQAGVEAVCWPGGVAELLLRPRRRGWVGEARLEAGLELRLEGGALFCRSATGCALCEAPMGAQLPQAVRLPGVVVLTGACADGQYAVVLDEACRRVLFSDHGREAALQPDGTLRLVRALDEMPGRAQAETWLPGEAMDAPLAIEPAWLDGAPRTPRTPQELALCAVRYAQLGEMEAAMRCFAPAAPCREALLAAAAYDGALPLKYAPPDGRPAVGLVETLCANMIRVRPAAYRCAPGGAYGWQLEELEVAPR